MRLALVALSALLAASSLFAGMPAPLPENPERILRLGDSPVMRLQTLSFFLLVFFLSAALVKWLWNSIRRDIPALPRLTFGRAVAGVFLWGLLFVIVLTMISGARELMTPGAWRKQGFTYKIVSDPVVPVEGTDPEMIRRRQLEQLRTALWQFAATHNGQFPSADEMTAIATPLWELPDAGRLRYIYRPGLRAQHVPEILAYEPEIVQNRRFVLKTNGDIVSMTSAELNVPNSQGTSP